MANQQRPLGLLKLLLLLSSSLLVAFDHHNLRSIGADARVLPSNNQQRYVKLLGSLGLECRCCDGGEEEAATNCRSSWVSSCEKLECLPWKLT